MEEKYGVLPKGMVEDIYKRAGEKEVNRLDFIKNQSEIAKVIRKFGGFYFNCYENVLKLDMPKQYLFRFIYLCTYMNYDNKIEFGSAKGERKLATERDLKEILMLSPNEVTRTKKPWFEQGLVTVTDKSIEINRKYAFKGEAKKRELKGSVRIMEEGIREIYQKAKPIEHKKLTLLIEILPYVNYQHNLLCYNPEESDIEKIRPMSLSDLAKQYNLNQTRLKNELFKIKVGGEDAVGLFTRSNSVHIYINPRIYYKGNDKENYCWVSQAFKVKQ